VILDDERQGIVQIQKRPTGAVSAGYCDTNYDLLKHALQFQRGGRCDCVVRRRSFCTFGKGGDGNKIPIVFEVGGNPVELRLVSSFNRPGGNLTGVTSLTVEMAPKRLEVLRELIPTARTFAVLINPTAPINVGTTSSRDLRRMAAALGVKLLFLRAAADIDFAHAFASLLKG
jgi:ABC transporter substrate binding protein